MRRFLDRLAKQDVGDGKGNVFFWRYTLFKCRWFSVYLHEFLRSDQDKCLHDHPWSFIAILLRDGYWEWVKLSPCPKCLRRPEVDVAMRWRRPGSVLFRPAAFAHRIEIEPYTRPWSLVIVGRKIRPWGFYEPGGWVAWKPGYSPICEEESP
jgi:hypothetical protein